MTTTNDYYSDAYATLGERLGVARESAGISVNDLAGRLGVTPRAIMAWETDSSEPRSSRFTLLGGILGVSPGWLLTGRGEGVNAPSDGEETASAAPTLETLLAELREAKVLQTQVARRMARIEDAVVAMSKR